MHAAETVARDEGKTLLVLDADPGGDAERLYTGYRAGLGARGNYPRLCLMARRPALRNHRVLQVLITDSPG